MHHPLPTRPAATGLGLILALALAACGGGSAAAPSAGGSSAGASGAPPASAAPSDPGPAIDTPTLLGDAARDGQVVRVRGFFLAADGVAQLCDLVLESYPPQCGGSVVRLTGQVPQDVLDALESTSEPGLAQATWGQVLVTGTFRQSGTDGQPTIELSSIELDAVPE